MEKLAEGVYCRMDPEGRTNVGFIDCGDHLTFVDTTLFPYTTRTAIAEARAITNKPFKYLVNTHFHPDHTFGNQEFQCTIVAHKDTPELMRHHLPGELERRTETFPKESRSRLEEVKLTYPTQTFENQMTLERDPPVELIHVGGHTPDSLVVFLRDKRVVFCGDLIFSGYHPFLKDAAIDGWLQALDRLKNLNAKVVIPGHGLLTDHKGAEEMAGYLRGFRDNLIRLKKEGRTKSELTQRPELLNLPRRRREERVAANIEALYDRMPA